MRSILDVKMDSEIKIWDTCILKRKDAGQFLNTRERRANTFWEENQQGNLEQECKLYTFFF